MRTYLVWEVEYPDEGSFEVRAKSKAAALKAYMTFGDNNDPSYFGVCLLTPELRAARKAYARMLRRRATRPAGRRGHGRK